MYLLGARGEGIYVAIFLFKLAFSLSRLWQRTFCHDDGTLQAPMPSAKTAKGNANHFEKQDA